MATMTVISSNCKAENCEARATRRVIAEGGKPDGDYCARHANVRLVELAKEEGKAGK